MLPHPGLTTPHEPLPRSFQRTNTCPPGENPRGTRRLSNRHATFLRRARTQSRMATQPARTDASRMVNGSRSEEHTSELQSHVNLVCRLLLEQKKTAP